MKIKKLLNFEEVILSSKKIELNCKTMSLNRDKETDKFIPQDFQVEVNYLEENPEGKTTDLMNKILRFCKKTKSRDSVLKVFVIASKNNKKLKLSGKELPKYRATNTIIK